MKLKGTITVFLSLILMLILAMISAVVESAAYYAARMKTELVMDLGLESVFAEYNRQLLEKYDLYFIDTSYGCGTSAISNTCEHLRSYMDYNFKPQKGKLIFGSVDFPAADLESVDITNISYATDNCGRVFKRQAIQAIEDIKGISAAKALAEKAGMDFDDYRNSGIENEKPDERQRALEEELDGISYRIPECPAVNVFDEKPGMLDFIMDTSEVSDKHIDTGSLVSHRTLKSGCGVWKPTEDPDSAINELLFDEYIIEKCSRYTEQEGHDASAYEIEYILEGENTDIANLRNCIDKMLILRYAADTIYIMSGSSQKEEVEPVVEAITTLLCVPEASEAITDLILLAWAYGESVSDVKRLMAGERVPLQKSQEDWRMPLSGLFTLKTSAAATGEEGDGLSYEDYLRIFLMLEDKTVKCMRTMDVVEMNVRTTDGNDKFCMDGCAEYLDASAVVMVKKKYELSIKRDMSYMENY